MKWLWIALVALSGTVARAQSRDSIIHAVKDTGAFVMHRSPLVSTLLSAAVPGAGQLYNGDYLKIPVIWGVGGFLLYEVIHNNNEYLRYKDIYFNSADSTQRHSQQNFSLKEAYRDDRDYYAAFLFLVYVLNLADAYVGAHLFDFPGSLVSRVSILPAVTPSRGVGAAIRLGLR